LQRLEGKKNAAPSDFFPMSAEAHFCVADMAAEAGNLDIAMSHKIEAVALMPKECECD